MSFPDVRLQRSDHGPVAAKGDEDAFVARARSVPRSQSCECPDSGDKGVRKSANTARRVRAPREGVKSPIKVKIFTVDTSRKMVEISVIVRRISTTYWNFLPHYVLLDNLGEFRYASP
jgi:hypothetical protein